MPKVFYTEKDIEDLVKQGIQSLEVNENVALTDLAYEKANRLGLRLVRGQPDNPPAAPVRPYLAETAPAGGQTPSLVSAVPAPRPDGAALHQRIREVVLARLGNQVDSAMLDVIITRVLNATGTK